MASYKRYPPLSADTSRSDEELRAILYETAQWALYGPSEQVLCSSAASLRHAVERAAEYAASGAIVASLSRLPEKDIVVDAHQLERLARSPHMVADDIVGNWLMSLAHTNTDGRRHG